jgi:hypothetical protein
MIQEGENDEAFARKKKKGGIAFDKFLQVVQSTVRTSNHGSYQVES